MPRRPPVALLTAALVAACSGSGSSTPARGPVTVTSARIATPAVRASCAALVRRLPQRLGEATRRATRPEPSTTAAWGDPAITLVCPGPEANPLDDTFTVDGQRFALHDVGAARTWTTLRREPVVVVTVPDAYQNQAELVGELVGPLRG